MPLRLGDAQLDVSQRIRARPNTAVVGEKRRNSHEMRRGYSPGRARWLIYVSRLRLARPVEQIPCPSHSMAVPI